VKKSKKKERDTCIF